MHELSQHFKDASSRGLGTAIQNFMHWFLVDLQRHPSGPDMQEVFATPLLRSNTAAEKRVCMSSFTLLLAPPPVWLMHCITDNTDFRWEFPALKQPVCFFNLRWMAVADDQLRDVVAGPGPMTAIHPSRFDDQFSTKYQNWKAGNYGYNQKFVWDSRLGTHCERTFSAKSQSLSALNPLPSRADIDCNL